MEERQVWSRENHEETDGSWNGSVFPSWQQQEHQAPTHTPNFPSLISSSHTKHGITPPQSSPNNLINRPPGTRQASTTMASPHQAHPKGRNGAGEPTQIQSEPSQKETENPECSFGRGQKNQGGCTGISKFEQSSGLVVHTVVQLGKERKNTRRTQLAFHHPSSLSLSLHKGRKEGCL